MTKWLMAVGLAAIIGLTIFLSTRPKTNMPLPTPSPSPLAIDTTASYSAVLTTNKGGIKINLFASETPIAVNNFITLAQQGFYNGTPFHRVISGFMVQGGDPEGTGRGGPGYKFADEPITRNYTRGTLAMANSGPNPNGSQFFIIHQDYPLPKNYVIFGSIDPQDQASLTTLDTLANTPVTDNGQGEQSKPLEPLILESVTIETQ